jgi:hypothetical protein
MREISASREKERTWSSFSTRATRRARIIAAAVSRGVDRIQSLGGVVTREGLQGVYGKASQWRGDELERMGSEESEGLLAAKGPLD